MTTTARELEYLRNQLADRMDELPPEEWSVPLVQALISVFDLYIQEAISQGPAVILELVKQ